MKYGIKYEGIKIVHVFHISTVFTSWNFNVVLGIGIGYRIGH
jgi:hypothetical protein